MRLLQDDSDKGIWYDEAKDISIVEEREGDKRRYVAWHGDWASRDGTPHTGRHPSLDSAVSALSRGECGMGYDHEEFGDLLNPF